MKTTYLHIITINNILSKEKSLHMKKLTAPVSIMNLSSRPALSSFPNRPAS